MKKHLIIESDGKEKTEFEQMIEEINSGDITALERYSRWSIWNAHLKGELDHVPAKIELHLAALLDSCRESL